MSPTPSGYSTVIDEFHSGGLHVSHGRVAGYARDIVYRSPANGQPGTWIIGAADPGSSPNASLNLGDTNHEDITFSAWSNRAHMVAGGRTERLTGNLDHEPGATAPSGRSFGYSAPEPENKCQCGFVAYRFSQTCPKCHRALR